MSHPSPFVPVIQTYPCSQYPSMDLYSNALFTRTNEANHSLVHCPKHQNKIPFSFSVSKNHPWCILLFCETCNSFWSVCSLCPNSRVRMINKKQCNRHHSKYHSSHVVPPTAPPLQTHHNNIPLPSATTPALTAPLTAVTFPVAVQPIQITSPTNVSSQRVPILSREESHQYFTHNQTDHLGPASIVSLAHYKNRMSTHQIPPQEVYNHILIAQHVSFLTKGQKKNFAHLLRNLLKNKQSFPSVSYAITKPVVPTIPTTFAQIRTIYSEGRHSILQNLPYPAIQTNVPDHCYIKISDVIEDFLAHGFLPLQPNVHLPTSWISEMAQSPQLVRSLQSAMSKYGNKPFFSLDSKNGKMITSHNMPKKIVVQYGAKT